MWPDSSRNAHPEKKSHITYTAALISMQRPTFLKLMFLKKDFKYCFEKYFLSVRKTAHLCHGLVPEHAQEFGHVLLQVPVAAACHGGVLRSLLGQGPGDGSGYIMKVFLTWKCTVFPYFPLQQPNNTNNSRIRSKAQTETRTTATKNNSFSASFSLRFFPPT